MKKIWIIIIILIIIAVIFISKKSKVEELKDITQTETEVSLQNNTLSTDSSVTVPTSQASPLSKTSSFIVNGGNFYFKPNIIKVKQGDTITITFINDEGMHDLKIDEYSVATSRIGVGAQEQVIFVADKKGSFEYYCSVGTHRQMGMKGILIVE